MPVAFPSRDYDAEEVLCLLHKFEATLVEKSFTSIQTYANAIDDFVKKNVVADLEPFFRTIAQNIQMFCSDADGSIIGIHEGLRAVTDQMEKVSGKIQDNFLPFLQEGSFLVHGDSELLANVLEDCLQQNPNVDILILEGLPSYSGINLLNRLKESPVVQNNPEYLKRLLLAPDSSALRLLQRRKCNFVLFGAHAVTPHGCLVNSAGSLQLATLAKESNVAVYSLCPTFKFYLSMPRMPFSSDDLEVLGAKLVNSPNNNAGGGGGAYGGRANSTHSSHSHTSSPTHTSKNTTNNATSSSRPHDDELLLTGSQQQNLNANNNTTNNNNNMGQPLGSNSDRLSRNSPSLQIQQQHQSITNASFSAPPPSIQISPQLHPALAGGNSGLNANNNNSNNSVSNMPRPQQPPFSLSTPPDASASSNNNIVRPSTSTPPDDASSSAPNSGTNLATTAAAAVANNTMRSNASSVQGSVQLGPSVVSAVNNNNSNKNNNCGTNSAPQVSPVLTATSPFHGPFLGNSMNHETSNNQNQRSTSNGTPSQQFQYHAHHALPTASTLSKNDHQQQHGHPPDLHNHNYFAPTCAFQLDLIGADKITHFFTEHGVVMPWSVADKISKIFLKEIQNKRKVNRGMGAGGVGGGVGGFGGF